MNYIIYKTVSISWFYLLGLLLISHYGAAQIARDSLQVDSVGISQADSMEVMLLRTTSQYRQIELLISAFPIDSPQLDLLPAVLPVNLPLSAFKVSSPFGIRRHPIRKQIRLHAGLDVSARSGTPVVATAPGYVVGVGQTADMGLFVHIKHAFGFETYYGHLSGVCVRPGQLLRRGDEIGRVGMTGLATGPHLHYTIKKNGSVVDPYQFCFLMRRRWLLYQSANPSAEGMSTNILSTTPIPSGSKPISSN